MDNIYEKYRLDKWTRNLEDEHYYRMEFFQNLKITKDSERQIRELIDLFQGNAIDENEIQDCKRTLLLSLERVKEEIRAGNATEFNREDFLVISISISIIDCVQSGGYINYPQLYKEAELSGVKYINGLIDGVKERLDYII